MENKARNLQANNYFCTVKLFAGPDRYNLSFLNSVILMSFNLAVPNKILILFFLMLSLSFNLQAQTPDTDPAAFQTESEELVAVQRLINETFPSIEALLKKDKTFAPVAAVIMADDSLGTVDVTSDKAAPDTGNKVAAIQEALSIGALKGEYKAVAIFYDTTIADPNTGAMIKVVAVFAEHTNDDFAYLFYYPYRFTARKDVEFGPSFGDFARQVMYKP